MTAAALAHRDKATEAWNAYVALVVGGHLAWAAVALGYSALHHIDTYIYDRGMQVGSHGTRQRIIANARDLATIASSYDELYSHSLDARYGTGIAYSARFIESLEQHHYTPIRDLISHLVR